MITIIMIIIIITIITIIIITATVIVIVIIIMICKKINRLEIVLKPHYTILRVPLSSHLLRIYL